MPIHDQGYRRYLGTRSAIGRSWQVMTRAGVMSVITKRVFIGMMLWAWAPFVVRAVQIYVSATFAQASFLAPKGETFREFLDQQGLFVFFVTIYVGAGLIANDRRANAMQLYLSKPMTSAEYIAGKLAILFIFLTACHVPAGHDAAAHAGDLGGQPRPSFATTSIWCRPSRCTRLAQVLLASTTMLALSSMSKSSRFVAVMYAGPVLLHAGALQRAARHYRHQRTFAWLAPTAALAAAGRRDLPACSHAISCRRPSPALAVIVLIAGSIVHPRCAASAAWRSSHDAPRAGPGTAAAREPGNRKSARARRRRVEVVRPGQRPQQRHRVDSARHHRAARTERRRQVDVHEADDRSAEAEPGHDSRAGRADLGQPAAVFARIGFCPEQDAFYDRMTGLEWVTRAGAAQRPATTARPTPPRSARIDRSGPDGGGRTRRSAPTARACGSASSWRRRSCTIRSC